MSLECQDGQGSGRGRLARLTAAIVSSYVAGNPAQAQRVADLISEVHQALSRITNGPAQAEAKPRRPAVPVSRSVQDDFIVCLEDGRRLKMLKRYLRARYGMSAEDYRRRWSLPADYPMVAPNYAARRSDLAKRSGLGRHGRPPR
ncbi:MAG TPA: MucR family transcriptional regulator [Caulobacteraceae bacterium]|nr:MucR family transcriptional regulator [Caulobacteraceae bacterium]